jgi:predicted metal-dependent hydrolase
MTVRPDKSVTVRVPPATPLHVIRAFVTRQAAWIAGTWEKIDRQGPAPVQSYASGAHVLFMGAQYCLVLEQGPLEMVQILNSSLVVTVPDESSPSRLAELVHAWYREQARKVFRERLAACHQRMQPEGAALPPLMIRPMKSRWGSYSYRTRRITLNLNLIKLPQACLDYVICHELCHIIMRHHGPDFWRLVARHCPDYAELRRQLKTSVPYPL